MTEIFSSLPARVVNPNRIGFVKFIIESYDGLATISTTDPHRGEILLRFHPDLCDELLTLLDSLGVEFLSQTPCALPNVLH